jgi:hypothetical protein
MMRGNDTGIVEDFKTLNVSEREGNQVSNGLHPKASEENPREEVNDSRAILIPLLPFLLGATVRLSNRCSLAEIRWYW